MWRVKEFLRNNYKIVIIVAFILILVILLVLANINRNKKIEQVSKVDYEYFAMYSTSNKVGVIDKNGKLVIEAKYTDVFIPNPSKPVFLCYSNESDFTILDESGKELYKDYDDVEALQTSELNLDFDKTFLTFKKDGKYGVLDYNGKVILSAEYDSIQSLKYRPGELLLKKDGKYGVLGSDGKIKIEIKYDSIVGDEYYTLAYGYGETGYIVGEKNDSGYIYGYLNNYGDEILKNKFESISRVLKYDDSEVYLIVMNNGKKGVYKGNKEIVEQKYQSVMYTDSSNVFVAKRNSKYGIFNTDGNEILPVEYAEYSLAGNYIYVGTSNGEKELYDVNGNKVSNLKYKSIGSAGDSGCYIAIDENGYYSIITRNETIENQYTYISYAYDNYFIFKNKEGYYGLLNIYSGSVIEPEYTNMLVIDGRKAIEAEKLDGTVDIFSKDIKKVLSMNSAVVENIDDNYTMIFSSSDMQYINKEGKIVKNTEVYKENSLYAYKENGKWGYKNSKGKVIIEAKYDFATELNKYGFAGIVENGKWGVVNSAGEVVAKPEYELDTYYLPNFVGKYVLELTDTYHCLEME